MCHCVNGNALNIDEKHSHYRLLHFRIVSTHTRARTQTLSFPLFHCQYHLFMRIKSRIIRCFNLFPWFDIFYLHSFEIFSKTHLSFTNSNKSTFFPPFLSLIAIAKLLLKLIRRRKRKSWMFHKRNCFWLSFIPLNAFIWFKETLVFVKSGSKSNRIRFETKLSTKQYRNDNDDDDEIEYQFIFKSIEFVCTNYRKQYNTYNFPSSSSIWNWNKVGAQSVRCLLLLFTFCLQIDTTTMEIEIVMANEWERRKGVLESHTTKSLNTKQIPITQSMEIERYWKSPRERF